MPRPRQFSIMNLLILMAATAFLLGLASYSPLAGIAGCPAIIGAYVGHRKSRSLGGAFVGVFSGYFFCVLLGGPLASLMLFPLFLLGLGTSAVSDLAVLAVVVFFSAVGGHIGGVVEITANEAREKRRRRVRPAFDGSCNANSNAPTSHAIE